EEAKRKRNLLIAKQKRAQAQKRIHETMSGLSDTSAFEAFDRMAEKIEESERRSLAAAEVDEALTGDTLEQEFARLESGSEAPGLDDRLLALKREMGLLAAGDDEVPKRLNAGDASDEEGEEEAEEEAAGETEEEGEVLEAELLEEFERLEQKDGSGT
ncbi:MAG TPA: PspA/IM30 family protein, partial [Longimicrobiales bacterium]|nr:PspA/IM30 family protein [Longimicrobiales bacterium]